MPPPPPPPPGDVAVPDGGDGGPDRRGGPEDEQNRSHCADARPPPPPPSSSYGGLLGLDSVPLTDAEKVRRIVTASAKGFSIGAGLKGGLALFSVLVRLRRRRLSASMRKAELFSNREAIVIALKETLRYGLFLGTFAGTFVSVDEIVAALGGHRRTGKWRALLAGAIAGPSMLLTGLNTQHTSLAIYILMRAAVLASRCGIKSKRFGKICRPLTWKHGDIFLMCLSSSQILSAYILKQESLPPSYKSFLNKHGGKDVTILQGVKEIASGLPFTNLQAIEKYYKSTGVDVKLDPEMKIPCSMVHGNQSCSAHAISFLIEAYKRALPVYLPVYLVPALIVHRKGLLKRPYTILGKGLFGTARSSLFLSVYCASAWMWTCILFRIFKRCNVPMVAMGTFPTGLALAIEKKSRRIEISLYCLARAIESFFTCLADVGYLPKSRRLTRVDVVVFSISTAIIMHCYAQEREVFRSKYLNVLDWVFGVPPPPCETPRCKQSSENSSLTLT
ncbi:transmembrane protein 135 homolog isoform X1 [Rhodamnia argentea]|uniref:Transmembrane protein 135 homolog isoform X1 n=2 Tax=Rhodamnia argentea TaxID=178133 RepID=A0ABM3H3C3_9MYRT|nr:transmembrane protein 135 homolog isoform X1 [Rhodamnia argentea]